MRIIGILLKVAWKAARSLGGDFKTDKTGDFMYKYPGNWQDQTGILIYLQIYFLICDQQINCLSVYSFPFIILYVMDPFQGFKDNEFDFYNLEPRTFSHHENIPI